jgi:hypothetical protein
MIPRYPRGRHRALEDERRPFVVASLSTLPQVQASLMRNILVALSRLDVDAAAGRCGRSSCSADHRHANNRSLPRIPLLRVGRFAFGKLAAAVPIPREQRPLSGSRHHGSPSRSSPSPPCRSCGVRSARTASVAGRAARHRGPPQSGPCRPASRWCRSNDRHFSRTTRK